MHVKLKKKTFDKQIKMVAKFNKKIGCCVLSVGLNAIVLLHIVGAVIAGVMIIIEMCKTERSLKDEHHCKLRFIFKDFFP